MKVELILANADKIINTTRFSWSKRVVGEQVPDQIIEDVAKTGQPGSYD